MIIIGILTIIFASWGFIFFAKIKECGPPEFCDCEDCKPQSKDHGCGCDNCKS